MKRYCQSLQELDSWGLGLKARSVSSCRMWLLPYGLQFSKTFLWKKTWDSPFHLFKCAVPQSRIQMCAVRASVMFTTDRDCPHYGVPPRKPPAHTRCEVILTEIYVTPGSFRDILNAKLSKQMVLTWFPFLHTLLGVLLEAMVKCLSFTC